MKNRDRIEVNVKGPSEGQEMSLFLPWDANLDQWRDAFKVVLKQQTFADELIKELFPDEEY